MCTCLGRSEVLTQSTQGGLQGAVKIATLHGVYFEQVRDFKCFCSNVGNLKEPQIIAFLTVMSRGDHIFSVWKRGESTIAQHHSLEVTKCRAIQRSISD